MAPGAAHPRHRPAQVAIRLRAPPPPAWRRPAGSPRAPVQHDAALGGVGMGAQEHRVFGAAAAGHDGVDRVAVRVHRLDDVPRAIGDALDGRQIQHCQVVQRRRQPEADDAPPRRRVARGERLPMKSGSTCRCRVRVVEVWAAGNSAGSAASLSFSTWYTVVPMLHRPVSPGQGRRHGSARYGQSAPLVADWPPSLSHSPGIIAEKIRTPNAGHERRVRHHRHVAARRAAHQRHAPPQIPIARRLPGQ